MFEKFDEAVKDALAASKHECMRLHTAEVEAEHLLLSLTRDPSNLAAQALASMNIHSDSIQKEFEKEARKEANQSEETMVRYESICFSTSTHRALQRANDYRRFFGRDRVKPEHLLLGIIDLKEDGAVRILEELGANLTFLRRQVMSLIAQDDCLLLTAPAAKPTVIIGIAEIISEYMGNIEALERLAVCSDVRRLSLPERSEIVLMVFLAYLPEFLLTQVTYQRYLLEETLRLLQSRTGPLDKETVATMVSVAAQNLRAEVRTIVEHLWTQEYRMLSQMPDEAEHEEIGSVIEDLWWTYSEEIALHEVFDEAMDDYRRKHVLNLQKRKLEISQRLSKLRTRLEDTLKQCFMKRTVA